MSSLASVLQAIESGVDRVKTISAATGVPVNQVWARLHDLKQVGLVRAIRVRGGKSHGRKEHGQQEKRYLRIWVDGARKVV